MMHQPERLTSSVANRDLVWATLTLAPVVILELGLELELELDLELELELVPAPALVLVLAEVLAGLIQCRKTNRLSAQPCRRLVSLEPSTPLRRSHWGVWRPLVPHRCS